MKQPFTSGQRFSGNQMVIALKDDISPPATPRPIMLRAKIRVILLSPMENRNAPSAAESRNAACTRRGPKRSSSMPSGIWNAAKAKK